MNTGTAYVTRLAGLLFICAASLATARGQANPANSDSRTPTSESAALKLGTFARLLQPVVPAYPPDAKMLGQEGWVTMSFVISPDGKVQDPVVVDSNGIAAFESTALQAITRFRYSPATWNGVPVEQCSTAFKYVFRINQGERGGRPEFLKTYMQISALIDSGAYAKADSQLSKEFEKGAWNLYEDSWLRLLSAQVSQAQGDDAGQAESLRRATTHEGEYLSPKTYQWALRQLLPLEIRLGRYHPALAIYGQMTAESRQSERARAAIQAIETAITGSDPLRFQGVIGYRSGCTEGRPNWYHDLVRSTFMFTDADADDDFELRCDWRRVVADVVIGKPQEVPAEWGKCRLFVFGEVGGAVELVEPPAKTAQSHFRIPPLPNEPSLLEDVNAGIGIGSYPSEN